METLAKKHILTLALISIPAAVLTADLPWFQIADMEERVGVVVGLFSIYLIFFSWIKKLFQRWQEYRRRVKEIEEIVGALGEIRLDIRGKEFREG